MKNIQNEYETFYSKLIEYIYGEKKHYCNDEQKFRVLLILNSLNRQYIEYETLDIDLKKRIKSLLKDLKKHEIFIG